jgi:seryl-tRNA synthetase
MIDPKIIREKVELVQESLEKRGTSFDMKNLLSKMSFLMKWQN